MILLRDMLWAAVVAFAFTASCATGLCMRPCSPPADKLVDLTHPLDETTIGYPGLKKFRLKVINNGTTDAGFWLQIEDYSSNIHVGTHVDAPCHIRKGKWCLDKIPPTHFIGPAAVVNIRHRTDEDPDANLEVEDLVAWECVNKKSLHGYIVLVDSGWGPKWSDPEAFLGTTSGDTSKLHFPGISHAAALWIAKNRRVLGVGIDTTSLDNGQAKQRRAHEALFDANIYGIENVANIDKLPACGAKLFVFPMKITNASGAPVRIMATLP